MKEVIIEINRKKVWMILLVLIIISFVSLVFAFNLNWESNSADYNIHGHSPDEYAIEIESIEKTIQEAINAGDLTLSLSSTGFSKIEGSEWSAIALEVTTIDLAQLCSSYTNSYPIITDVKYSYRTVGFAFWPSHWNGYCVN